MLFTSESMGSIPGQGTKFLQTVWCGQIIIIISTFFFFFFTFLQGSWASLVAQLVKNLTAVREIWVRSLGWKDPLEKGKATHSSILAWRIPWTVHGVTKSRTQLSDFYFHAGVIFIEALEANFALTFASIEVTLDLFPFITEANFVFLSCPRGRSYIILLPVNALSEQQTDPLLIISWEINMAEHVRKAHGVCSVMSDSL